MVLFPFHIAFTMLLISYQASTKTFPDISSGIGRPIKVKMVGAISPSFPGFTVPRHSLSMINKGTGLVVCAVFGEPSSLIR